MLASTVLALAFAAVGLAQTAPAGYRRVYMTSNVDTKFIVVPKTPVKNGTTTVVFVSPLFIYTRDRSNANDP